MAAGFSVANDAIDALEASIEAYMVHHRSEIGSLAPDRIDAEMSLVEIDLPFHKSLASLAPFGPGNPRPRFLVRDCSFDRLTLVGNRRQHLKGHVTQGGTSLPFIAFRMGRHLETFEEAEGASLVCQIGFDDWRGNVQAQGVDLVTEAAPD